MRLKRKVLEKAERLADIPLSAVCGAPVVQLDGYHRVSIENHMFIVKYESDHIDIACRDCVIRVSGQNLEIRSMNTDLLVITGQIASLSYSFGEGAQ